MVGGLALASFIAWTIKVTLCWLLSPVSTEISDHLWAGVAPRYVTKPTVVNSALHHYRVAKLSTSLNWPGKCRNVTSATQHCHPNPTRHVNSRSGEACLWTPILHLLYFLSRRALYRAKAAYSHQTFLSTICCVCVRLSVQCIVAKWLIGYGFGLGS